MRNHKDSNQKAWIALILGGCLAGLTLFLSLWKKKSCSSELSGKEKKLCLENKKASIFQNKKRGNQSSEYRNPFEGKKVIFVENPLEAENADGVRGHLEAVGDSDYIPSFYTRVIKRGGDTILSAFALVLLSPVFLFLSIAIFLDDPGPIFFTQKRLGKNKRYFPLHKFRSMKMCTPHDTPTHMLENPEQYITHMGKFLRAHSLDELPQIWDIFVGNMSIIGPRPGLWNQDLLTAERDKYNANDIQPGLSGWAQINGRDSIEIPDKAKLDGEYVEKIGFLMDLRCFFGTIFSVLRKDGVVEGGTGATKNLCCKENSKKEKSYSVLSEKSEREERCENLIPPIKTMEIHENIKGFGRREFTKGKSPKELIGNIGFGERVEVDKSLYRRVLITGADSYVGSSFKKYAKEHYPENFSIDELSLRDESWKEKKFSDYDIVYHVAGIAHADIGKVSEETKEKYYQVNTDLTIAAAMKAKEEGVKCFVFMSSMIVYGDSAPVGKKKIIDENTVPIPANFYGDSKLQADVAVRDLADDKFKVIVLRPPMIYGKDSKGNYPVLAKFAKKIPIFLDIDNKRSMLYIFNLCELLCQIMIIKDLKQNATVLLPQNSEWTITSCMVAEIAKVTGRQLKKLKGMQKNLEIVSKIPGKIGTLVTKVFGNNCYKLEVSIFHGIDYQKTTFLESIDMTEGRHPDKLHKNQKQILVISQYFYPEQFRVNDICREWVRRGNKVTVVTGIPNYPQGEFYEGYNYKEKRSENWEGVEIIRLAIKARKCGKFNLSINYLSFVIEGYKWVRSTNVKADMVFIYEVSPMTQALVGVWYAKKNNVKCKLYVTDLWPENIEMVLGIRNKLILKPIELMVDYIYKNCDIIFTSSKSFIENISARGISKNKLRFWPQYAEDFYKKVERGLPLEIPDDGILNITFAGNLGTAQGLEILVETAQILKDENILVRFNIIGNGRYEAELKRKIKGAKVEMFFNFISRKSAEKIPYYFAWSDVALITLSGNEIYSMTIPAKTQSCLACGIPILVSADGEVQEIIKKAQCGFCSNAGDSRQLAENIKKLISLSDNERKLLSENAIKYYKNNFDKTKLMNEMERYI